MATFRYVDLFAGIGGFTAAMERFGGENVYAVEIDKDAAAIYEKNWGHSPLGDITDDVNDDEIRVPPHDVLLAGFPCQPFSKSGAQRGMEETRGTLFWYILKVINERRPAMVMLENVRNLAGPRHRHDWEVIIRSLREAGYVVSSKPAIFSPHLLEKRLGGRPQIRERVFITATYDPERAQDVTYDPDPVVTNQLLRDTEWNLASDLPLEVSDSVHGYELSVDEQLWIAAWADFVLTIRKSLLRAAKPTTLDEVRLPGFPIWVDAWVHERELVIEDGTPPWKVNFLEKNAQFYTKHKDELDKWLTRHDVKSFPRSRRKFEWQAQTEEDLWKCAMQLRPSGIRVKRTTHLPALVAIAQTPIIGPAKRKLTVREAARLQGFSDDFDFGDQPRSASYKQLGNAVNIGVVSHVFKEHILNHAHVNRLTEIAPDLVAAARSYEPEMFEDSSFKKLVESVE